MDIGSPTDQDCRVDKLESPYPILNRLVAQNVSVDELDYLAKRLGKGHVAGKATLPKQERREVTYFQPEQVEAIRDALELEPIKWRTLVHMLLITGARRGEVLGLKWDKVNFEGNKIHICNSVLYSADRGIYEDSPKTATSNRFVTLPLETMKLPRKYRAWQNEERLRPGEYYQYQGFVFAQDSGKPMHPDSVTTWLDRFSKRHGLPHINPHAFRHTIELLEKVKKSGHFSTK